MHTEPRKCPNEHAERRKCMPKSLFIRDEEAEAYLFKKRYLCSAERLICPRVF